MSQTTIHIEQRARVRAPHGRVGALCAADLQRARDELHDARTAESSHNYPSARRPADRAAADAELASARAAGAKARELGESHPVASNDTAAGRQQNCRVDVVFSNTSGRFSEAALSRQGKGATRQ
jgi:hypothetical protein